MEITKNNKKTDLFKDIPAARIQELAVGMKVAEFESGHIFYHPGENQKIIYFLEKGEVLLYTSHRGKKLIIETLTPGSVFGSLNLKEEVVNHFAETSEKTTLSFFTIEDLKKIFQEYPSTMVNFLQIVSDRLQSYERRMISNLFDAKEKIIHHIEIIRAKNKSNWLYRLSPCKHVTHQKLSDHTGLTRETVTRAVNDLKKAGEIKTTSDGKIIICDK